MLDIIWGLLLVGRGLCLPRADRAQKVPAQPPRPVSAAGVFLVEVAERFLRGDETTEAEQPANQGGHFKIRW